MEAINKAAHLSHKSCRLKRALAECNPGKESFANRYLFKTDILCADFWSWNI
ncbi:hypothetical protein [Autumnicola psychrophila]|uniref:Uncharacterized protein n=1 Tax=Autumnicola psychrophila TaxID=3075592 RepID=A0ABU3DQ88_9FLAO|nr:hypothetical protein [Zunongwangia sp. F225]MDT0685867.1 hypothetical protein [Zunongwangia sp. F225]